MFNFILLLFVLLYFFTSLMYMLYRLNNEYYKSKYNQLYQNKFKGGDCPSGCKEGVCHKGLSCRDYFPYNEECCNFDFECNNCNDTFDNKIYKEHETSNPDNINELIKKQNEYINNINKEIEKQNN